MRIVGIFVALALVAGCKTEVKTQDHCGDEFLDPGEACDGANLGGQDCVSLGHYENVGAPVCTPACTFDTAACGPRCGDNTVDVDHGEVCDAQQLTGNTCVTLGFTGGALACGADCQYDISGCISVCGNGVVEPDEGCDDAGTAPADGCAADCTVEPGWDCTGSPSVCEIVECGDDVAAGDEPCDGTDLRAQTCEGLGFHGGALACPQDCGLDLTGCEAAGRCGDGARQASYEACDGADLGDATCETLGWHGGTGLQPSCLADCTLDESECELNGRCGDDVLQSGFEDCDGVLPAGASCADAGSFVGTPACGVDCAYDLSGCHDAVALAAGDVHACVLDDLGRAFCWGSGRFGRLGNGGTTDSPIPVPVTLPNGVTFTAISANTSHTCALDTTGVAWCWGGGYAGRLGNGAVTDQTTPVRVTMPANRTFTAIAAGSAHTCAIDDLGNGWCWGAGSTGQLGNGGWNEVNIPTPVAMPSATTFTAITAGYGHTCAVTNTTALRCWGYNNVGQVGNNQSGTNILTPAGVVAPGVGFRSIDAGYMTTCAVSVGGEPYCWGQNTRGQVGDGTTTNRLVPVPVLMPGGFPTHVIAVHAIHACALSAAGELHCWGGGEDGELGLGGLTETLDPQLVGGLPRGSTVDARDKGTCALTGEGQVWCWGTNDFGQLGLGGIGGGPFTVPMPVESP